MITEEEKAKRRKAVEYAKASVELEGIHLSNELLEIANKFADGYLTIEEFGEQYELALQKGL